jgi:hypothetical protein
MHPAGLEDEENRELTCSGYIMDCDFGITVFSATSSTRRVDQ